MKHKKQGNGAQRPEQQVDWQAQMPGGWQPGSPAVPPAPEPQRNWFVRHKIISGIGVLAAVAVIATVTSSGGDGTADAASTPAATASVAASPAAKASDAGPAAKAQSTGAAPAHRSSKAADKPSAGPGIGDPVRDGKFEFTVTKVKRGVPSVGSDFMQEKAQGSYTLVYLTVKNIGDQGQYFTDDNQKVLDASGRQFEADSTADMSVDGNDNVLFQQINPGNSIQGVLVFDLPKGTKATSMELHDSMFSGGTTVQLH